MFNASVIEILESCHNLLASQPVPVGWDNSDQAQKMAKESDYPRKCQAQSWAEWFG